MTQTNHGDDVAFIRALAELLRDNDLTELKVKRHYTEDSALDVTVTRKMPTPPQAGQVVPQSAPMPASAPVAAADPAPATSQAPADPAAHPGAVTSPMVGTVYLSAEPGAAPFVRLGSQVEEGQTLLIVEAMKTMNHIAAPRSGSVTRILVDDGSPVEYGAPLLIIE